MSFRPIALVISGYAQSSDGYYPDIQRKYDGDTTTERFGSWSFNNNSLRRRSLELAGSDNYGKKHDMRPLVREYMESLNDTMICPLAHDKWQTKKGAWDIDGKGISYAVMPSYMIYTTSNQVTKHFYQNETLRKVGGAFEPRVGTARYRKFSILASDVMWGTTYNDMVVTQRPHCGDWTMYDSWINSANGITINASSLTYANYAGADGSVSTFPNMKTTSIADGTFVYTNNRSFGLYLPASMEE